MFSNYLNITKNMLADTATSGEEHVKTIVIG